MDVMLLNLLVIGGFAIVGGIVFLILRQKQAQNREKLQQFVDRNGWRMELIREPLAQGFQLHSSDWSVEALSRSNGMPSTPGSSNIEATTTFTTQTPGSTVLVGPRYSQADLGTMGDMLSQKVLQLALGEAARDVQKVELGSTEFQQSFLVWAQDPFEARELINPDVQSSLLSWKKKSPIIKRTYDGLSLKLDGFHLDKPEELEQFVRFGEYLLGR